MYLAREEGARTQIRSLILACLMLLGALATGVPNVTALTGNETVAVTSVTNNSAYISVSNLDSNDTYYWWAFIYSPNGTLYDFDYGYISGLGGAGTINYGVSWTTPTVAGNYTINGELSDGVGVSLVNDTQYFTIGGGGGTVLSETIIATGATATSANVTGSNLNSSQTYQWYAFVYYPSGSLQTSDSGIWNSPNSTTMTDSASWSRGNQAGNYTLSVRLYEYWSSVLLDTYNTTFYSNGPGNLTPDSNEPNEGTSSATSITLGAPISGVNIHNSSDDDYYTLNITSGSMVSVNLTFSHSVGDLQLNVYEWNGLNNWLFDYSHSTSDNEQVIFNVTSSTTYYVQVFSSGGASNYSFSVQSTPTPPPPTPTADVNEPNDSFTTATAAGTSLPYSQTNLSIHNSTDDDYFSFPAISGVTYWVNISFTDSNGDLDMDLYDGTQSWVDGSSSVTDDESVTDTPTSNMTMYAYVYGWASATNNYDITIESSSGGSTINVTGNIATVFFSNATYGEFTMSNLTNTAAYEIDAYLLEFNGTNYTSLGTFTQGWTSNGSNHVEPAFVTLREESTFCLYAELYDMTTSTSGVYLDDDLDCLYHEMMEGFVTSDTTGTLDAQNLSTGDVYYYEWYLYIGGGTTYLQSGSGNFTANTTSQNYNINWNQPGSSAIRCLTSFLFNATYVQIGQHQDCFNPTWPGISATGLTANSNSTSNTFYFDAVNLNVGNNYVIEANIERYSNGTVVDYSAPTNFTATSTNESFNWVFNTPSVSGYYCAYADLWNATSVWMGNDSICFLIIHDDDSDGVWNENDLCPNTASNATVDIYGCAATQRDSDNDGVNDAQDAFPFDGTQWQDSDGDGYGDNASGNNSDAFPTDSSQWSDTDGDGYGDNPNGTNADAFPNDPNEWVDSDGDGVGDNGDLLPNDASQWVDSDGDGYGDNPSGTNGDAFPSDSTQWSDSDGDGYGDNSNVTGGDLWPNDPSQWWDSDGDGYGDNTSGTNGDAFPSDSTQWSDGDGDGWGDNPNGTNPDAFPQDGTQWSDQDGDGYGDNANGNNPDAFPTDGTQWADQDGDGYGDNPLGNYPDAFPTDGTQWADGDGDGYGDNPQGTNADAFPTDGTQWADRDSDGYGDNPLGTNPDQCPDTPQGETVDSTGCSASERDSDGDGVMDASDDCLFENATGWDNDGDGCIDDTDGDGYDDPNDNCINEDSTGWDTNHDGCIDDTDGDLVKDNVDACPTTNASGFDSDLDGCIDDSDGDMIPDDQDDCRYVNASGYDNDGDGCIDDSDGDNIKDNIDSCPYENATGFDDDQDGCVDDNDNDGVKDNVDDCANTQDINTIDNNGCSDHQRDTDSDTVKDFYDNCPNTMVGEQVNTDGCAANQRDTDGDYVVDSNDACPGTDDGLSVDNDGCAESQLDTDNDSIDDSLDQCSNTPSNETANNYGCSKSQWDSDGDQYMDSEDDCPNVGGTSTIDRIGCLDSDGDGVSDLNDAFPQDATKQAAADSTEEGGFSPLALALVGMFVLFSIVAGAILVLRMRGSEDEEEQFSGSLTAQPAESFNEMAMPTGVDSELGLNQMNEGALVAAQVGVETSEPEQWVDENGVTWHRQPDGAVLFWNGEAWEPQS